VQSPMRYNTWQISKWIVFKEEHIFGADYQRFSRTQCTRLSNYNASFRKTNFI
jgi:hypothetical protein